MRPATRLHPADRAVVRAARLRRMLARGPAEGRLPSGSGPQARTGVSPHHGLQTNTVPRDES